MSIEMLGMLGVLAGGIVLLIFGGDLLVRGAVALADRLGVPALLVGLTVVAFGTSAPELALNMVAASKGNSALSFGNIVGSNIANIGLILGLSAIIAPLVVNASVIKRELPIMVLATLLTAGLMMRGELGLTRIDGVILLVGFLATMVLLFKAGRSSEGDTLSDEAKELAKQGHKSVGLASLLCLGGLGGLVGGGYLAEMGAVGVAKGLGWSDDLIGLTVVAVATSLPELVTSITAVRRGQVDIAVGNVVGSNIFNLLLVMGATALIAPVPVPDGGMVALAAMVALSLVLIPMTRSANQTISRVEGMLLVVAYFGYMAYAVMQSGGSAIVDTGGAG